MIKFIFDRLVDAENICNLKDEEKAIVKSIRDNGRVIIYAPRNYGKTSLLKNVIIPKFKKTNKNSFVFFSDLMEVKDMNSLIARLLSSFEYSFSNSFPVKKVIDNIKYFFQNIKPEITIDPVTSQPGLSLKISRNSRQYSVDYIFSLIKNIADKIPCLIVIDEFQDIINVDESQAIFRQIFEDIGDIPIIIMGSKKHILSQIFSSPQAPLSFWGQDLEFKPIDYAEYHRYIDERFKRRKLILDFECAQYIQDILWRVPEPINMVCNQIFEDFENKEITKDDVNISIKKILESKEGRYESYLSTFTQAEETVCINISKHDGVEQPNSKTFVAQCGVTPRAISRIITKFLDKGIIEKTGRLYRLTDPLFNFYLKLFR